METNTYSNVLSFERVRDAVADSLGLSPEEVLGASKLRDLGDSLELAQLMLDLEADFSTEIPDDDVSKLFTVDDIMRYLKS